MNSLYETKIMNGKRVYIFEDHAIALLCWAEERKNAIRSLNLISLDHHTDTHPAFTQDFYKKNVEHNEEALENHSANLKKLIDFNNQESLFNALNRLKHDEHIDAAIGANIIHSAFVISTDNNELSPQESMRRKIYVIGYRGCTEDCDKEIHDDDCYRKCVDQVIESEHLSNRINHLNFMTGRTNILSEGYILDIDLDYFNTIKSINPKNKVFFYDLIRESHAITIAKESQWVYNEALDKLNINSNLLLERLILHITEALEIPEN